MARVSICSKNIADDHSSVSFDFSDGESLVVNVADLPEEAIAYLITHGISARVGDSYSGIKTPAEAREKAQAVVENLQAGILKAVRSGGSGVGRTTQLAEAVSRALGVDIEAVKEKLAAMDDATKKALRSHPQVTVELAKIQAEAAAKKAAAAAEAATEAGEDLSSLF